MRAMKRAEDGLAFFSGIPALCEVAKEDGKWSWALVGPDPIGMPLSGGGKTIEEMQHAIGNHPHAFGLVRMRFGLGDKAQTKFLFIHASVTAGAGKFTMKERGQAMLMEPEMERVIKKFVPFSAKVRINSPEECTADFLIDQLQVVRTTDVHLLTMVNFNAALEETRRRSQAMAEQEAKHEEAQASMASPATPRAEVAEPEAELPPAELTIPPKQRKHIKLYKVGDMVEVYSLKSQEWIEDAEIAEVVTESCVRDKLQIRAGSMKVLYSNRRRFKWVAPQQVNEHLRPSQRPKPPEPRVGKLLKETHIEETEWYPQHVELNMGYLQWWEAESDARVGQKATVSMYLLGLQLHEEGSSLIVRSNSTRGTVFKLRAEEESDVSAWSFALWEHAGYCEEVRDVKEAKKVGRKVMGELMHVTSTRTGSSNQAGLESISTERTERSVGSHSVTNSVGLPLFL